MPKFSFSVVKKPINKQKKQTTVHKIINKKVIGIVHIDLNGNYYVNVNDVNFPIVKECYNIKGKDKIFAKKLKNGKRFCVINAPHTHGVINEEYLPFAPGCIVMGDIVQDIYFAHKFHIKNVSIPQDNKKAKEAFKYWKEHYEEIQNNINNGINSSR